MSTITWLHISDLHWRESQAYNAHIVADALLKDLANREQIAPELEHIDCVFFTGDLAFASRSKEYKLARQFFAELLRTTQVRKSHLFIVPGNHDVDRKTVAAKVQSAIRRAKDQQAINDLFENRASRLAILRRFHRYRQFCNDYLGKHLLFDDLHYSYTRNCTISGKRVSILGLNSAWASASDADRLRLLLGEQQVRAALKKAKSAEIRIALLHHPFEWLRDFDRADCEPILVRGCDFVLLGHLHDTDFVHLKGPGVQAVVIGAGACYETRKHPNAYNLVHLDLDSGKGTVYFRTYSNRESGFWAPDVLRYPDVPGKYIFDLPAGLIKEQPVETPKPTDSVVTIATATSQIREKAGRQEAGLDRWWGERGYSPNPFAWSNAADVTEKDWAGKIDSLFELFAAWHVDPNIDISASLAPQERDERKRNILRGLGDTPTLDNIISPKTAEPVVVYAPVGGGKTFYRRWAICQIQESSDSRAVDIHRIAAGIRDRKKLTVSVLAGLICEQACEQLGITANHLPKGNVYSILDQFEKSCQETWAGQELPRRVYVFVDGIDQLFDTEPDWNSQVLKAIIDLVKAADKQAEGERLALRVFLPIQLQGPIEQRWGHPKHVHPYRLQWTVEHCTVIVERRLSSCWKGERAADLVHLSRLFAPDALDEFLRWLQRREVVSPRCVISVINSLAEYAWIRVLTDPISVAIWNDFVAAEKPASLCRQDADYPLSTRSQRESQSVRRPRPKVVRKAKASKQYRVKLRKILTERFSEDELRTLCFDLHVDYENLPGEGKAAKARELLAFLERYDRIGELVRMGQQMRKDIPWKDALGNN